MGGEEGWVNLCWGRRDMGKERGEVRGWGGWMVLYSPAVTTRSGRNGKDILTNFYPFQYSDGADEGQGRRLLGLPKRC